MSCSVCLSLSLSFIQKSFYISKIQHVKLFPLWVWWDIVCDFRWVSISIWRAEWSQTTSNQRRETCSWPQTLEHCIKVCVLDLIFKDSTLITLKGSTDIFLLIYSPSGHPRCRWHFSSVEHWSFFFFSWNWSWWFIKCKSATIKSNLLFVDLILSVCFIRPQCTVDFIHVSYNVT